MDRMTRRGFSSCSMTNPSPSRSSTPVRKFSTSTSARRTSSSRICRSSSSFRLRAMDSLLRLAERKYVDSAPERVGRSWGLDERRTPPSRVIAYARRLDLDDPRAEIAEHHRGVRTRECPGQIDHEGAGQRACSGGGHGRVGHLLLLSSGDALACPIKILVERYPPGAAWPACWSPPRHAPGRCGCGQRPQPVVLPAAAGAPMLGAS